MVQTKAMSATSADRSAPLSSYNSIFWCVFSKKLGTHHGNETLQMFSGLHIYFNKT